MLDTATEKALREGNVEALRALTIKAEEMREYLKATAQYGLPNQLTVSFLLKHPAFEGFVLSSERFSDLGYFLQTNGSLFNSKERPNATNPDYSDCSAEQGAAYLKAILDKAIAIGQERDKADEVAKRINKGFGSHERGAIDYSGVLGSGSIEAFNAYLEYTTPEHHPEYLLAASKLLHMDADKIGILFEKVTDEETRNKALNNAAGEVSASNFICLFDKITSAEARNAALKELLRTGTDRQDPKEEWAIEKFTHATQSFVPSEEALLFIARCAVNQGKLSMLRVLLPIMQQNYPLLISTDGGEKQSTLLIRACKFKKEDVAEQMAFMLCKYGAKIEPDSMMQHPLSILQQRGLETRPVAQMMQEQLNRQMIAGRVIALRDSIASLVSPDDLPRVLAALLINGPEQRQTKILPSGPGG